MMEHQLPILDETRCIGDASCVMVCPTNCLEMLIAKPWLARPADCIGCGACAAVCPTGAIYFNEVVTPLPAPDHSTEPSA